MQDFNWYDNIFDVKKTIGTKHSLQNLAPIIVLTNPNDQICDSETGEQFQPPGKLQAKVLVAKAEVNYVNYFHLIDIGVKGNAVIDFNTNRISFQQLKFSSTSYHHDGAKFHLVVLISLITSYDQQGKILISKISPPIFVDSRKAARESQKLKIELFSPELVDKKYIIRKTCRKENSSIEVKIDNTLDGLYHYYTAPNIRNKVIGNNFFKSLQVKHPFFLLMRFSKCIKLFYNSEHCNGQLIGKTEEIIETIQELLFSFITKSSEKNKPRNQRLLIVLLDTQTPEGQQIDSEEQIKSKKVKFNKQELKEILETDLITIEFFLSHIPLQFQQINQEDFREAYINQFPKLSEQFQFSNLPVEDNINDQQQEKNQLSDDDSSEDEISKKSKINPNKQANTSVNGQRMNQIMNPQISVVIDLSNTRKKIKTNEQKESNQQQQNQQIQIQAIPATSVKIENTIKQEFVERKNLQNDPYIQPIVEHQEAHMQIIDQSQIEQAQSQEIKQFLQSVPEMEESKIQQQQPEQNEMESNNQQLDQSNFLKCLFQNYQQYQKFNTQQFGIQKPQNQLYNLLKNYQMQNINQQQINPQMMLVQQPLNQYQMPTIYQQQNPFSYQLNQTINNNPVIFNQNQLFYQQNAGFTQNNLQQAQLMFQQNQLSELPELNDQDKDFKTKNENQ